MPQTSACSAPASSKPSARAAENTLFSIVRSPWRPTSGAVCPSPFGYCSLTRIGSSRMRAAASSVEQARATAANESYGRKPSCTSTTTSAARSRDSKLMTIPPSGSASGAHQRQRAVAVGNGARGERQQHATLQFPAGKAAVLRAALPAVLAGNPRRVEIDQHEVRLLAGRDRRGRQLEKGGSGGHALDQQRQIDDAREHEAGVESGE